MLGRLVLFLGALVTSGLFNNMCSVCRHSSLHRVILPVFAHLSHHFLLRTVPSQQMAFPSDLRFEPQRGTRQDAAYRTIFFIFRVTNSQLTGFDLLFPSHRLRSYSYSPFMMPEEVSQVHIDYFRISHDAFSSLSFLFSFPSSTCSIVCSSFFCHKQTKKPPNPEEPPRPAPKPPKPPPLLPTVDGQSGQLDVVSRLLKDRILLLGPTLMTR